MNDKRTPLPDGTKIEYNRYVFNIEKLIGRGGSCLVYEATYHDETGIQHECILKQLYPLHDNTEQETASDLNFVSVSPEEVRRFLHSASTQKKIREQTGTINSTSNIHSVFSYKDSVYFQFAGKQSGLTLDKIHFDTIHEYIGIIIQVAEIIKAYHIHDYLHLDIKPENIFCITDNSGDYSVSMFDFDSLQNISNITDTSVVLSCSENYAPPELVQGKREKIGITSDFYEIGCMLFEKIYGRFPESIEISGFRRFKFETCDIVNNMEKDFLSALQDFFRHTITINTKKRYSTDDELIGALECLYRLSEKQEKYIVSNFTTPSTYFAGRNEELHNLEKLLDKENHAVIQGVGGIGKSSLALQYANRHIKNYHTIVYLEYQDSFDDLIDTDIQIEGIPDNISIREKYDIFRSLCDSKTLIILDNLNYIDNEVIQRDWFSLPCHVVVTSRTGSEELNHCTISLNGLQEAQTLFYHYYQKPCSDTENQIIRDLIYTIDSHTMMTELLGKFCNSDNVSRKKPNLQEIYKAFKNAETEQIGFRKVRHLKDWTPSSQSVQRHMDILFSIFSFSENEQNILKFFALMPLKIISNTIFTEWCPCYDSLCMDNLIRSGIIQSDINGNFKMHPLVADRVLHNYQPQAYQFASMSEKMSDSLLASTSRNRNMLYCITEHYTRHLKGIHESLASLYQTMTSYSLKDKKELYIRKSKEMFSELKYERMPFFFEIYDISEKYRSLSWFYDDEAEKKEAIIDKFISICDEALAYAVNYRPIQNYEQISKICYELYQEDIMCINSEKEEAFCKYQVKFLEKALEYCTEKTDTKRIASVLYNCYNDICSPVENAVIAEKYRVIADEGVKFYNSKTHERTEKTEQEIIADIIEAMRMEHDTYGYLALADEWYNKYVYDNIQLYHYLRFLMELIYEETGQWEKYMILIEDEKDKSVFSYDFSLELGKAYYHLGQNNKATEYLIKATDYFGNLCSKSLNSDSEKYLIAYGLLTANNIFEEKRCNYEEIFFSACDTYFEYSLLKKADELAVLCMSLSRMYFENISEETAFRYLILYARFRDAFYVTEEEYHRFEFLYNEMKKSNINSYSYWIMMFIADYKQEKEQHSEALQLYKEILSDLQSDNESVKNSCINEYYIQIVCSRIEVCDEDYFNCDIRSKINYECLHDMELSGMDEPLQFDSMICRKLKIVRNYENIHSKKAEVILNEINLEISNYSGDMIILEKAMYHVEQYYANRNDINSALKYSYKRYNICKDNSSAIKKSQICLDIAYYYSLQMKSREQLYWLEKSNNYFDVSKLNSKEEIEQCILSHEKILAFYTNANEPAKQIHECQKIEYIIGISGKPKYDRKLAEIYAKLHLLFLEQNNVTQAYYYKTLEELIIQKSI